MPTDDDRDNAQNPGNEPRQQTFTLDTSDLDRRIAEGVSRGFSEAIRSNQPRQIDPSFQEQRIEEDDDNATVTRKTVHNALIPVRQQFAELQNFGLEKFADLTDRTTSLPYREKYKNEFDHEVSLLPVQARTNPETLRIVHDRIVARHLDDIRNEGIESEKRRYIEQDAADKAGRGSNSRQVEADGTELPNPEDLFDESQLSMIEERGGRDGFARRISAGKYTNWSDYARARVRMSNSPKREGMVELKFARMGEKKKKAE